MKLVAFDFDGTITRKDTLPLFIRFSRGNIRFFLGLLLNSPYILAYLLKLYPNGKAKERLLKYYFQGVSLISFNKLGAQFAEKIDKIVRPEISDLILKYQQEGAEVIIVTASVENWVRPWAVRNGIRTVLGTQLAVDGRKQLSGSYSSPNCYGQEKVKRILERFPDRHSYTLIAYGDSNGDREMIAFADKGYLM